MKLAVLFIFALLSPFTIFVAELMYGGTSPQELKKGLSNTNAYVSISEFLINVKPQSEQDELTAALSQQIYERFTPAYIQSKTDKLIDDGYIWITQDGPSPVLSFTDIKQDMLATDPSFAPQFDQIRAEMMKNGASGEESLELSAGDPERQSSVDALTALAQNDFTVPVGEYFQGLKQFYAIMQIVTPILILLLFICLLLQLRMNNTLSSRLRWIGASLLTASIFGYGMIFFNDIAVQTLAESTMISSENFLATFAPLMVKLMELFMEEYAKVQMYASIGMFIVGGACLGIAKINQR